MEMDNRAGTDEGIQIAPDCRSLIRQPMEPHGVLRIEHRVGGIDRRFKHIGSQRQFWTLLHEAFEEGTAMPVLQRIRQPGIRHTDQLKKQKRSALDRRIEPGCNGRGPLGIRHRTQVIIQALKAERLQRRVG